MKKYFLLLLIPMFGISSCLKNNNYECQPQTINIKAPDTEINNLRNYLTVNSISTQEDPRGFFYNITTAGSGAKPNSCNGVTMDYVARLTNGTIIDQGAGVVFQMSIFITGLKEGLPLIAPGGVMVLYLPPSLAYGSEAIGDIPANSNLIFNISLKAVY